MSLSEGRKSLRHDLPVEIYSLIVDEVRLDDSILTSMALVCQLLRSLAQPHLFRSVVMDFGKENPCRSKTKLEDFLEFSKVSPHLAGYVQSLEWTVVNINRLNESLMAQFLFKCGNIRTFRFKMIVGRHMCAIDWHELDPQLAEAISCVLKCPSLHLLELCMWKNFPLQNLRSARNLKHLVIDGVNEHPADPHLLLQPTTRRKTASLRLKNLHLGRYSKYVVDALVDSHPPFTRPTVNLSRLRMLSLTWHEMSDIHATYKLMSEATRVRVLEMRVASDADIRIFGLSRAILRGSCRTLRKLTVYLPRPGDFDPTETLLDILEELRCLGNKTNKLHTLEIKHRNYHALLFDSSFLPLYHELDTLLASAFPSLRTFRIRTISLVDNRKEQEICLTPSFQEQLRSMMESCFPKYIAVDESNIEFSLKTENRRYRYEE
ncbi:hypothetical protein HYPSUDRAFT_37774 [Hypholoma sublateritium FD-334 SS-4]|uniref:F-box domain-containing protein n=1 Tax=Hypholoma sublateritium (strain FD-334 SS-4) TaxID=945553 RepID=A0A0D2P2Y9_HYPSF|nr:hypothetical protein HYPSUDRAFT_37774 [Hypholoma sublateritium FD-334 SS-4]